MSQISFEDALPALLEAFRDFVRAQQGQTFRVHARKFGTFIRDAIKFPPAGQPPKYLALSRETDFMGGNDHLPGLALSRLAEAENSVITPVDDGAGEAATRAGVGFIYQFAPGSQIDGPGTVPVSKVKPPKTAIRYVGDITRMMGSIKNEGQHVPITVRPVSEGEYRYEVVDGFTRYRSIDCLGYLHKVKVVVEELDDASAMRRALTLNMVRYQMSDLEQGKTFETIIGNGWATAKGLAASIGYSEDYVRTRLELAKAPAEIQERFIRRDISMERALSMTRLIEEEKVEKAKVVEIIDHSSRLDLSQRQVADLIEEVQRDPVSVGAAVSKILERDNRTAVNHERRTVIATRSARRFVCAHGTEYQVDWDRAEIFTQSKIEEFTHVF